MWLGLLFLLVIIYGRKNKMMKVSGFAVFLMEFSSPRWQTIFIVNSTVCDKSLIVTSHVWTYKNWLSSLLCAQWWKVKVFCKFRLIVWSLEFDHYNATTNDLIKGNLKVNVVNQYCNKQNCFAKVVAFCHVIYR